MHHGIEGKRSYSPTDKKLHLLLTKCHYKDWPKLTTCSTKGFNYTPRDMPCSNIGNNYEKLLVESFGSNKS
jgi:hypothetical protein